MGLLGRVKRTFLEFSKLSQIIALLYMRLLNSDMPANNWDIFRYIIKAYQ